MTMGLQAKASKFWGLVKLDWDALAAKLVYGTQVLPETEPLPKLEDIKKLLPLCRCARLLLCRGRNDQQHNAVMIMGRPYSRL